MNNQPNQQENTTSNSTTTTNKDKNEESKQEEPIESILTKEQLEKALKDNPPSTPEQKNIIKEPTITYPMPLKVNKVKDRQLILSPTVLAGLERECNKNDFYREGDRYIGKGGFGEVWKVIHKATSRLYCIKVIDKKSIVENKLVEQMNREIEIMYKVNHPHLMKLVNHFEDDDKFYYVMHYASKGQLYSLLRRQVRFDQRTAAQYMRETIEAVRYLHSFSPKILHRDIKPENLLLDEAYRVVLSDFGWANYQEEGELRKTFCGTPEYLSPEMIRKTGHDHTVDIWALGVLLFEMLAGYAPFTGSNQDELFLNIKKLKINWPLDFPPIAKNLVNKILKLDPKERITLQEIINHPWFEKNPPLRPVLTNYLTDEKDILESHLINVTPESVQDEIKEIVDPNKRRKFATIRARRGTKTKEELKAFVSSINEEKNKLIEDNSLLKEKVNELEENNDKLKSDFDALKKNFDDVCKEKNLVIENEKEKNVKINNDFNEMKINMNLMQKEIEEYKKNINEFENNKIENEKKIVDFNNKINEFENENKELKLKIENLNKENENLIKEKKQNENDFNDKLNKILNENDSNPIENKNILTNIKNDISNFQNNFENKINSIENNFKTYENNFNQTENKINEITNNLNKNLLNEINNFKEKIDINIINSKNKYKIDDKKNELIEFQTKEISELKDFKQKFLDLKNNNNLFEEKNKLLQNQINTLTDANKELITFKNNVNNNIKKINEKNSVLQNKINDISKYIEENCNDKDFINNFKKLFNISTNNE